MVSLSVGLDIGTSNIKLTAGFKNSENSSSVSILYTDSISHNTGKIIQDTTEIIQKVDQILFRFFERFQHDKSILHFNFLITGQMHGIIFWNSNFEKFSNLISWQDQSCSSKFLQDHFEASSNVFGQKHVATGYGLASLCLLLAKEANISTQDTENILMNKFILQKMSLRNYNLLTDFEFCGTIMDFLTYRIIYLSQAPKSNCNFWQFLKKIPKLNPHIFQKIKMTDQNAEAFGLYNRRKFKNEYFQKFINKIDVVSVENLDEWMLPILSNQCISIFPALADHQCSTFSYGFVENSKHLAQTSDTIKVKKLFINLGTSQGW